MTPPISTETREVRTEPATEPGRRWRPRLSTSLLVGWCLVWAGWIPAASVWIPQCTYGEFWCTRAPVLSGSRDIGIAIAVAIAGALALAVVWWWDRHRAGPVQPATEPATETPTETPSETPETATEPPARRPARARLLVLGSAVAVVASAHLMLFAPPATTPAECTAETHLNSAMAYCLNVDSGDFLTLAHHPRRILLTHAVRQTRPVYVALSVVATRLIGPAASLIGLDKLYGQTDTAYFPLVLFNFLTAIAAVALLGWLLLRLGVPIPALAAICGFLAVNDVIKAFIWTPHQDLFTVFVPVLTVWLAQWVIRREPPWWKLALAGLGVGVYSLMYASVLITVAVVGIVLLARGWRGLARAAVFGAGFAALPLGWVVFCRAVVGSYYNHEVTAYHEFVWLVIEARKGPRALAHYVGIVSIGGIRELVSMAGLTLLLIVALAVVAIRRRIDLLPRSAEHRAILTAAVLTVAVSVVFGWAIGYLTNRMMFNAVPPLLLVLGWLAARVSYRSARLRVAVGGGLIATVLAVAAVAVVVPGPWG